MTEGSDDESLSASRRTELVRRIRPWRSGRNSFLRSELSAAIPCESASRTNPTLLDLSKDTELLAAPISPLWDSIKGIEPESFANGVFDLMTNLDADPSIENSVRVYQIFLTDYYTAFSAWPLVGRTFKESELSRSAFLFSYFVDWVENAPDERAVDAALFYLTRTSSKVSPRLLQYLGKSYRLCVGAAHIVHEQYAADETLLIQFAAQHKFQARVNILSLLTNVAKPEHKHWLLTEGYKSGADYCPCGYFAAIHGNLIDLLQRPVVDTTMLEHCAAILADMCQAVGGAHYWKTMNDYQDASRAVEFLFKHVERTECAHSLKAHISDILYYLHMQMNEEPLDARIHSATAKQLYRRGKAFFAAPPFTQAEIRSHLWWEQPNPTIDDLREKGPILFCEVLEHAVQSDDDENLQAVIRWAEEYLYLSDNMPDHDERRRKLMAQPMPGIRTGGVAALEDGELGSVFGQIILQSLQAIKGRAPMGEAMAIAAMQTELPHLPKAAADVLGLWPSSAISEKSRRLLDRRASSHGNSDQQAK